MLLLLLHSLAWCADVGVVVVGEGREGSEDQCPHTDTRPPDTHCPGGLCSHGPQQTTSVLIHAEDGTVGKKPNLAYHAKVHRSLLHCNYVKCGIINLGACDKTSYIK